MKSGNVSGQYVELQRAVLGKLPRDFKWIELDWLTQHTDEVGRFLDGMKGIVPTRFDFYVSMTYGRIEDVVKEFEKYVGTESPAIDSDNIIPTEYDTCIKKIHIFRSKPEDVEDFLKENDLRHALLSEVVSATKIPFISRCLVVAGGSTFSFNNSLTIKRIPYIYPHHSGKSCISIASERMLKEWDDFFFAGVEVSENIE